MKKMICVLFVLTMLFGMASCGKVPQTDATTAAQTTAAAPASTTAASATPTGAIDVDLTALSSTMVYSEVYNMMATPDKYIGKVIKAKGPFAIASNSETGEKFFAVRIEDATACCAQGLEFVWEGDHVYPDDYPEKNAQIQVTGTFNTYLDGDVQYCHLENAKLEIL